MVFGRDEAESERAMEQLLGAWQPRALPAAAFIAHLPPARLSSYDIDWS